MRSRKIIPAVVGAVATIGAVAGFAMTSANAATLNTPKPAPHVCAYDYNGGNVLDLTYLGSTYTYPVVLHEASNGLVTGYLYDKGLPAGQRYLAVHGVCVGGDVDLGVNYPTADPQGQRVEDMNVTPIAGHPHYGKAAGVWDETGSEAGSGAASLQFPVYRY
jgi:hypothetical protein